MIEVSGLSYTYPGNRKIDFADFNVGRGEHCLLLGESGCGKTTLLHLLGGLLRGGTGVIKVNGVDVNKLSEVELDKFRGKHLGFVFQKNHLISALNVQQNLMMAGRVSDDVLDSLNIAGLKNMKVTRLSHGQAQRVAIARALVNNPAVILADEPTSALDDKNCEAVIQLLLGLAKKYQSTLIIATHDSRLKSKITSQIQLR